MRGLRYKSKSITLAKAFSFFGLILFVIFLWSLFTVSFLKWEWKPWTGFGEYATTKRLDDGTELRLTKTLWDWMELFIVPSFLIIGAYCLNQSDQKIERSRSDERQRELNYQNYLNQLTSLLLRDDFNKLSNKSLQIIRAHTYAVLQNLDGDRKGSIVVFLYQLDLISMPEENRSIYETFLMDELNLEEANLQSAYLAEVEMYGVNLKKANLKNADLTQANLEEANLEMANLEGACLLNATLANANLIGANLTGANLTGANLTGAKV